MEKPYRAAIVGLGQVGMLFDSDQRRSGVWTHFTAYERLADRFELVAVADPAEDRRILAQRRAPGLAAFGTLEELLEGGTVDVISLCTPPELHAEQIARCAGRVKAIICEKPLSADAGSGRAAIEKCRETGTRLAVNYYKRFDGVIPTVRTLVGSGRLGTVKLIHAIFCGPLDAVGSHMADLLRFLFGEMTIQGPAVRESDRWSVALRTAGGAIVQLQNAGPREEFIFELDAIGDAGRVRVLHNCGAVEFSAYRESGRYSGYRELFPEDLGPVEPVERFLPLFVETAQLLRGERSELTSDGDNALRTQLLIDELAAHLS